MRIANGAGKGSTGARGIGARPLAQIPGGPTWVAKFGCLLHGVRLIMSYMASEVQ
jgi:hypothetical protein